MHRKGKREKGNGGIASCSTYLKFDIQHTYGGQKILPSRTSDPPDPDLEVALLELIHPNGCR